MEEINEQRRLYMKKIIKSLFVVISAMCLFSLISCAQPNSSEAETWTEVTDTSILDGKKFRATERFANQGQILFYHALKFEDSKVYTLYYCDGSNCTSAEWAFAKTHMPANYQIIDENKKIAVSSPSQLPDVIVPNYKIRVNSSKTKIKFTGNADDSAVSNPKEFTGIPF